MNASADVWNDYSRLFSGITSRYQQAMYEAAADHLHGSVIDCGCGTAKLVPYLAARPKVSAYLGIDSSADMVARGAALAQRFPGFDASVRRLRIEEAVGRFDAAVSLQSYYAWSDGAGILRRIRGLLGAESTFVLASANERLDIERLLDVASRELLTHPYWDEFARMNRLLAGEGGGGNFVPLDTMVREAREARFRVREAHAELFDGGLNFIVLTT